MKITIYFLAAALLLQSVSSIIIEQQSNAVYTTF